MRKLSPKEEVPFTEHFRAALVLGFLVAICYWPILTLKHSSLVGWDGICADGASPLTQGPTYYTASDPYGYEAAEVPHFLVGRKILLEEHVWPTWNPYMGIGAPLSANLISEIWNPLVWPAFALGERFFQFWPVIRIYLAALGAYLLASIVFELPFFYALTAGLLYALAGFFTIWYSLWHLSEAAILPWLLLVFLGSQKGPRRSLVLRSLVFALYLLQCQPEAAIVGCLFLAWLLAMDPRPEKRRFFASSALSLALGTIIASPMIVDFYNFIHNAFHIHDTKLFSLGDYLGQPFLPDLEKWATAMFSLAWVPQPPIYKTASQAAWIGVFGTFGLLAFLLQKKNYRNRLGLGLILWMVLYSLQAYAPSELTSFVLFIPELSNVLLHKYAASFYLSAALAAGLGLHSLQRYFPRSWVVFLVVFVELFSYMPKKWTAFHEPFPKTSLVAVLERDKALSSGEARLYAYGKQYIPPLFGLWGLKDVRASDALYPKRYWDFFNTLVYDTSPNPWIMLLDYRNLFPLGQGQKNILASMGVSKMIGIIPRGRLLGGLNGLGGYVEDLHPPAPGLIALTGKFKLETSQAELPADLRRDPFAFYLVSSDLTPDQKEALAAFPTDPRPHWGIQHQDSKSLQLLANASAPSLLVVKNMVFPGWKAWVDGRPTPILPVNHIFQGLFLPGGQHQVRLAYDPPFLKAACLASLLCLLSLSLLPFLNPGKAPRSR